MSKKIVVALAVAALVVAGAVVLLSRGREDQQLKGQFKAIFKALPEVESWSWAKAEKNEAGTLKINKLTVKLAGRPGPLTAEYLELAGFDENNLLSLAKLKNWREQPATEVAGEFLINNLIITDRDRNSLKIGRAEGAALKLAEAGADNYEGLEGFLACLRADRLAFKQLEVLPVSQGPKAAAIAAEEIMALEIVDDRMGRYQITGLTITDPPQAEGAEGAQLRMGLIAVDDLLYKPAFAFIKKMAGGRKAGYDPGMQFLLSPTFGFSQAQIKDLSFKLGRDQLSFSLAELKITGPITPGQMPALVKVSAKDAVIDVNAARSDVQLGQTLLQTGVLFRYLGYKPLTIVNFEQERAYNAATGVYRESYNDIEIKDAFKLNILFEFSDFEPGEILKASRKYTNDPFSIFFLDPPLKEMDLKLVNNSILERIYTLAATLKGLSVEETKRELLADLRKNAGPTVQHLSSGRRLLDELGAFIETPKSLEVNMKPSGKQSLMAIQEMFSSNDLEALASLNLTISFNGGKPVLIKKKN